MPYSVGHRSAVKKKIVESARRLFNRRISCGNALAAQDASLIGYRMSSISS